MLYSGVEDDEQLVRAASGALATLSVDPVICNKITTVRLLAVLSRDCRPPTPPEIPEILFSS